MTPGLTAIAVLAVPVIAHRLRVAHRTLRAYRGVHVVTCPHGVVPAAVELDRKLAAASAALGWPWLRLESCSRWPVHAGCSAACLAEIRRSPRECQARTLVVRWAEGRSCALCGQPLGRERLSQFQPALLGPEGTSVEWHDVPPQELRARLRTHHPICWYCHVVAGLRRERPDLVVAAGHQSRRGGPP
jgi:hypothetical protein